LISSASRALKILEIVGRADSPIGVADVARLLDVLPGTAFRSLHALEGIGFLERYQSSARYVLGPVAKQLHQHLLARFSFRDYGQPYLDQLSFSTGETSSLFSIVGWFSLRVAAAPGAGDVTDYSPVGAVECLERTIAGRTMLAFFTEERLAEYLKSPREHPVPMTQDELLAELEQIRAVGYGVEETPYSPGRASAALPICRNGVIVASIAIEGPVLDLADADRLGSVAEWLDALAPFKAKVESLPIEATQPFCHLRSQEISLSPSGKPLQ